jgi:hypothetical protein
MSSINTTSKLSIKSLANQISELSTQISAYFYASSQLEPDFTINSADVPDTPEYEALRAKLNDAALDLLRLVNGPRTTLRSLVFSHYDLAALQVALERRLFHHVPLPVDITEESTGIKDTVIRGADIAEISERAGMDEDRTARVLRLLATQRIFVEVEDCGKAKFQHTASSALFASDEEFNQMAHMQ